MKNEGDGALGGWRDGGIGRWRMEEEEENEGITG